MKFTCRRRIGASSVGRQRVSTPTIANIGFGRSSNSPSSAVMMDGVPQPSFAIGPTTKWSSCGGKNCLMSLMMRVMFAITSCGNRMLLMAFVRMPSASAFTKIVRFKPNSPPTPLSVNPKLSWMGVNSAVIRMSSEKPGEPSGIFVLMMPMALTENRPWKSSSSAPAYSPRSASNRRKPPPLKPPASSERPTPFGGLKATSRSAGPRLPGRN